MVCYLRLKNAPAAVDILDMILARSPNNEKALYHRAFCNRSGGRVKDAIANLSKVINTYFVFVCNCFLKVSIDCSHKDYCVP